MYLLEDLMRTETVPYREADAEFDAFVAFPAGEGPRPAVVICHAWSGRQPFEEDKARALAALGYVGVALDVYGVGVRGRDKASNGALMTPLVQDRAKLRRRLLAGVEAAKAIEGVDATRIGAIGFCFGGLCALDIARAGADLRGVVSFHGILRGAEGIAPAPISAKVLVCHGQDDPMVPPEMVGAFVQEMVAAKADLRLHAYPAVMHAFTNPAANDPSFGTVYDAAADAASWTAMQRFFADVFT